LSFGLTALAFMSSRLPETAIQAVFSQFFVAPTSALFDAELEVDAENAPIGLPGATSVTGPSETAPLTALP
jgi:hypothetical protein